tara:strand:- start:36771 stop:39011 length:2241 start_codon:yes stop_codon:yes gene_type:complete
MYLKRLELNGFKSFAKKTTLSFDVPITAIVGPNGSGKSNVAESFRWVLGEQSIKSLRGKKGEDLIFNGSKNLSRLNRANVTLVFDNKTKKFALPYEDIAVERVVYRDGVNEYGINNSHVRLRDVVELLSAVSLGASSHHIISQNESDRILIANARERKNMIEDALGLRIFHWKINESTRKLDRTRNNIKEAKSVRRELSGHLKYLQKEAEKIEEVRGFRETLYSLYEKYLSVEYVYVEHESKSVASERKVPEDVIRKADKFLDTHSTQEKNEVIEKYLSEIKHISDSIVDLGRRKDELSRQIGRFEGVLDFKRESIAEKDNKDSTAEAYSKQEIEEFIVTISTAIDTVSETSTFEAVRETLSRIRNIVSDFKKTSSINKNELVDEKLNHEIRKLESDKKQLEREIEKITNSVKEFEDRKISIEKKIDSEKSKSQEQEREYYIAKEQRAESLAKLEAVKARENNINLRKQALLEEIREAHLIFGEKRAKMLEDLGNQTQTEDRVIDEVAQQEMRREIEKLKIRIEEVKPGNDTVIEEYDDVKKRDEFLEKEIVDLETSEKSLQDVISDLENELASEFKSGVQKINQGFQKFFETMFGGGKASISVITIQKNLVEHADDIKVAEEESELKEEGVGISVSLPRKKINSLEMLSGGERALTSIALLFAMTQVKPPPFLILDETDAALDEANSKKYGDMLERLSKETQLILITHNRETMSRAGVLYGVTMDSDGVSKLLSVKFEEAVAISK